MRSIESDARAYDTEEGRKEHAPDLIAAMDDLAGTVRDLASQFPRSRDILANQMALELVEQPRALDAALQASESLAIAASSHPALVEEEAPEALRQPPEAVEGARTVADRAKHVGLRLLTALNFGRIVAQAREVAVEAGNELRKQAPKAAAGAVMGGASLAIGLWLGESGLKLLMETAGAIGAINAAVGHRGGAFDRLLKTIEKVSAKTPAADSRDPDPPQGKAKPPQRRSREKSTAKRPAAKKHKG